MNQKEPSIFDHTLFISFILLLVVGVVMVTSASIPITQKYEVKPLYFATNQLIYVMMGLFLVFVVSCIPSNILYKCSGLCLLISFVVLIVVLIPGISRTVNGSSRWIMLGPLSFQASEVAKLFSIIYLAGYLHRRNDRLQDSFKSFFIPLVFLAMLSVLLLLEPDFGATVVIVSIFFGMMLVAGVPWNRFMMLMPVVIIALGSLVYFSPYRMQRLMSFLNPWENQFDSGYQLVQSLIAIGRGGVWGTGLGGSIQKLFYLPEPHTDFIFAVLSEELGMVGALSLLLLFCVLFFRIFLVARQASENNNNFSAFMVTGILIWLCVQTFINLGVNMGILPTKGLSLPFISFGGSNLLVNCLAIGIVLRVSFENSRSAGVGP